MSRCQGFIVEGAQGLGFRVIEVQGWEGLGFRVLGLGVSDFVFRHSWIRLNASCCQHLSLQTFSLRETAITNELKAETEADRSAGSIMEGLGFRV